MIDDLDPVIHVPKRLAIMAMLAQAESVSFRFLREQVGLSDSDLSKQMSTLEAAGYVRATKSGRGRGATTTYGTTRAGRAAYAAHRDALRALLALHDATGTPAGADPADSGAALSDAGDTGQR